MATRSVQLPTASQKRTSGEPTITQQSMMVFGSAFLCALLKTPGIDLAPYRFERFAEGAVSKRATALASKSHGI